MAEFVSNADIKESVDKLEDRFEQLDDTIRGNNGEGVLSRLTRVETETAHHEAAIGRAFGDLATLEARHDVAMANIRSEHAEAIRSIRTEHTAARDSTSIWIQKIDRRMAVFSATWAMGGAVIGVILAAVAKVLFERML
jgi:hypothetical protein